MYFKKSFFISVINLVSLWAATACSVFAHTIDLPSTLVASEMLRKSTVPLNLGHKFTD
jgi:hypothetical protein